MVLVSFLGLRRCTVRLISVATVSFSVAIPGILIASKLEAFFYTVLTVIRALLAMQ
ncbi:MAG: putative DNA-binding ribbon-helix-helix protein [Paraglaciecola sp.]|jgi:predicted DNA-binding ribbon-helix-helix protein